MDENRSFRPSNRDWRTWVIGILVGVVIGIGIGLLIGSIWGGIAIGVVIGICLILALGPWSKAAQDAWEPADPASRVDPYEGPGRPPTPPTSAPPAERTPPSA